MKEIKVPVPTSLSDEEVEDIRSWFIKQDDNTWKLFKQNFNAFVNSLKQACKNFWSKICGWVSKVWNSLF